MSGFDFLDTVITVLGVAKKGAEVYNSLSEKQESAGFATPSKMSTRTSGGGAKASLQSMDQPIGLGIPNMETAYRYFSNNLSRDNNLRQVQAENYVAKRRPALKSTMTVAGDANVKGFTASYKTSGVPTA